MSHHSHKEKISADGYRSVNLLYFAWNSQGEPLVGGVEDLKGTDLQSPM